MVKKRMLMKCKKICWLLLIATLCSKCAINANDDELSIQRKEYNGNSLRMDGYYYHQYQSDSEIYYDQYLFYKNGIILYVGTSISDEMANIENEMKNGELYSLVKNTKYYWGVYQIIGDTTIQFERWYPSEKPYWAYVRSGKILNDTTFHITESWRSDGTEKSNMDEVYHFKALSPKPDSVNEFVK
jgi:hypothetical protein